MYEEYIMDQVFDFFQYPESYDRAMINASLQKISCNGGFITYNNKSLETGLKCSRENALGFFLANLPALIVKEANFTGILPPKLEKLRKDTLELIALGRFNELATLDLYLLLEMAMRCAYSKWLGSRIVISRYGGEDIVLENYDYRRLKLYIRLNGLGRNDIFVNGEPFLGSENSLLRWATKFLARPEGLMFRLSLNIRNLLAHGENEWDLYPVAESVRVAAASAGKLLSEIHAGKMPVNTLKQYRTHNSGQRKYPLYRNGQKPR
ncbi:MAG: hypothetical protein RE471_05055 [Ferroplasma sp.]|uniref:hypothetical protein n=1 Tax=Ferroplasma sp. TaxID=2591003 RepID=UPI002815E368|nr:hypothetical protein [Ferroplasma sp.]WMT52250.1 MAG: hypothetical protein RE471_05055 [Ferroplasma sp.]